MAFFKSRIEERGACLLGFAHIKWVYEAHSFVLETGETYTPDFWLPELGIIIETKGGERRERVHKPVMLARQLAGVKNEHGQGINVFIMTPERMYTWCTYVAEDVGDRWCSAVFFTRLECHSEYEQIIELHGYGSNTVHLCRICGKRSKATNYVSYDSIAQDWWDEMHQWHMQSWKPDPDPTFKLTQQRKSAMWDHLLKNTR